MFKKGDRVYKDTGDYSFEGEIIEVLTKRNGARRYAVEDDRGLLLIMNEKQITSVREET